MYNSIVIGARKKWVDALKTKNIHGILSCYKKEHIFKGTLRNRVTHDTHCLQTYFESLMKRNPNVTFLRSNIIKVNDMYYDSGTYSFTFDGNEILNANYQFVYEVIDGELKIVSHFSSIIR